MDFTRDYVNRVNSDSSFYNNGENSHTNRKYDSNLINLVLVNVQVFLFVKHNIYLHFKSSKNIHISSLKSQVTFVWPIITFEMVKRTACVLSIRT